MRHLQIVKFAFLLGLMACGPESLPQSEVRIIGGTPSNVDGMALHSTVALVSGKDDARQAFCSGVLIAPKLVLTAAHCLELARSRPSFQVLFGKSDDDPDAIVRDVEFMRTYKDSGSRFFPNFDIAWISLQEAAPEPWQAIELLRMPPKSLDAQLLLAGFGRTAQPCLDSNDDCMGRLHEIRAKFQNYLHAAHFVSLIIIQPMAGQGTCSGDSGGPALVELDGRRYLLGILNGKSPHLKTSSTSRIGACEDAEAIYTFAGHYASWLEWSSGIALEFDDLHNPAPLPQMLMPLDSLGSLPSLEDYLQFDNHRTAVWESTEALYAAFKFQDKFLNGGLQTLAYDVKSTASAMRSWKEFKHAGYNPQLPYKHPSKQQLSEMGPLSELKSLESLTLINNSIRNTSPLAKLQNLKQLTLRGNYDYRRKIQIPWDLRFIGNLPKLRRLDLSNNSGNLNLSEINWDALEQLESLDLSYNKSGLSLSEVPWAKLKALRELIIIDGNVRSLDAIADARSLRRLVLRGNSIQKIDRLPELEDLEELDISRNRIRDFSPLVSLKQLKSVKALGNPGSPIRCPFGAKCLFDPPSSYTSFADYCRFAFSLSDEDRPTWPGYTTVKRLLRVADLSQAGFADCERAHQHLSQMKVLNLSGQGSDISGIKDLAPLRPLRDVEVLLLNNNQLSDISDLSELKALRILNLAENEIRDVRPLLSLDKLEEVNLNNNDISSLGELMSKENIKISAEGNPLILRSP